MKNYFTSDCVYDSLGIFSDTDLCHKLRHQRETGAEGCTSLLTVLLDDNDDDDDDDHDEVDTVKVDDDDEEKEIGLEAAPVSQQTFFSRSKKFGQVRLRLWSQTI